MSEPTGQVNNLQELERITIQRVVEQVHGDKVLAGKMLGIRRATLYRKLKRYSIGVTAETREAAGTACDS
jgi:DNA-binding protein Fis